MRTAPRYGKLPRSWWTDPRVVQLGDEERILYLYLRLGPQQSALGLFCMGEAGLAEALGWSPKTFRKRFARLEAMTMVQADWKSRLVYVPDAVRDDPPANPNVVAGWASTWAELPECDLKRAAWRDLRALLKGREETFRKAFVEACGNGSANGSQNGFGNGSPNGMGNQDQDQDQEPLPLPEQDPEPEKTSSQGVAVATVPAPQEGPAPTASVWDAYSSAYKTRYGEEPVRNAKVNGQLAQFVKRLPVAEAPAVAAFYVSHPGQLYVRSGHCVDLLLRDAEKVRTEWVTGRKITETKARQEERTATNAEGWAALLKGGENVG